MGEKGVCVCEYVPIQLYVQYIYCMRSLADMIFFLTLFVDATDVS